MLRDQPWLKNADYLQVELFQARDEGKDIRGYEEEIKRIQEMDTANPLREKLAAAMLDTISALNGKSNPNDTEPSDIAGIQTTRPKPEILPDRTLPGVDSGKMLDKVYGAWLGRCAGCLLGQPIEGWYRDRILGLLKDTGNYPFHYYISSDLPDELREKYDIADPGKYWINNVDCMPEDDDTNYTILGLEILEHYGPGFTPDDVAESWIENLPILHVCTAERAAYKNIVNGIYPPESASFRNPYREWIGAQIRADFFGYVTPGNPELGAEMAWRDASISHVKNGIYGEMFVAAALSAAAIYDDIKEVIGYGLSQIPENSRLSEAVKLVLRWKREGVGWEQAIDKIHEMYDEKVSHHWCHTIPNAMIVCLGLIYGERDFEKTLGIAVVAAFDTDCNGATVGSILGMILGAAALPEKWIDPLHNQLKSGVDGFGKVQISDMAKRTLDLVEKVSEYEMNRKLQSDLA